MRRFEDSVHALVGFERTRDLPKSKKRDRFTPGPDCQRPGKQHDKNAEQQRAVHYLRDTEQGLWLTGRTADSVFNVKLFHVRDTKKAPGQKRASPVQIIEHPSGTA